ncbi:hypothetical protein EJB05_13950, partial [Eragrostis curvula]
MPPPRTSPLLMDELVEEILMRLPPDDPKSLVRAALVSKHWCRLISDAGFRRRFREFHGTAPILGFLWDHMDDALFVPVTSSSFLPHVHHHDMRPCDSRHGRVLLSNYPEYYDDLIIVIWDPIANVKLELPEPPPRRLFPETWNMAVLCDATASPCDHLDCHGGPFIVVLLGTEEKEIFSCVFSSKTGMWSEPVSTAQCNVRVSRWERSALVRNTLFFVAAKKKGILTYDLGTQHISVIQVPIWEDPVCPSFIELTTTEDGRPGFVRVENFELRLWSRADVGGRWEISKVINLKRLLPIDCSRSTMPVLLGSAEGIGVIFLNVKNEIFTIDLRSSKVTKVYEASCIGVVVPYLNFYTPGP